MYYYATFEDQEWFDFETNTPYTLRTVMCTKEVRAQLPEEPDTYEYTKDTLPTAGTFVINGVYYATLDEARQAGAIT